MINWIKIVLFVTALLFSSEVVALNAPLPDGFFTTESAGCSVSVPSSNASIAEKFLVTCEETKGIIFEQLGLEVGVFEGVVDVRIVPDPEDMKSVSPDGSAPPSWSGAVAYPEYNLVILSLHHHSGRPVEELETVLEHEISHIALRTALNGASVPRWFSEGVAIQQSEKSSIRRIWLVWSAALGDSLLPLSSINKYPDRRGQINLAYAQAADFTGFLIRKGGWSSIRNVVRKRAAGASFKEAIEFSYKRPLPNLERTWRAGLVDRWQWVPLVTGSGAVWGLIVILFFVAYIVAKRRKKKRFAQMEVEEMEPRLFSGIRPITPRRGLSPPAKPPTVPTKIRIDDDIHTLH